MNELEINPAQRHDIITLITDNIITILQYF